MTFQMRVPRDDISGSYYWNMVFGRKTPGNIWIDEEGMNTIRLFAGNVSRQINEWNEPADEFLGRGE
jgi:hypothetical protein